MRRRRRRTMNESARSRALLSSKVKPGLREKKILILGPAVLAEESASSPLSPCPSHCFLRPLRYSSIRQARKRSPPCRVPPRMDKSSLACRSSPLNIPLAFCHVVYLQALYPILTPLLTGVGGFWSPSCSPCFLDRSSSAGQGSGLM